MRSLSHSFDSIDHDLTDKSEIDQLLTLLSKYSYIFIRGFAKFRVKTGELEIRLKSKDKFVERGPYRSYLTSEGQRNYQRISGA